jgi:flagellar biogenesis protein FliO
MWLTVLLSLGIVVVLIVAGVWVLKLIMNMSNNAGRGRARRLHVIETATLDQKRKLMLVRRDNVEHLIMTGGAQDVVIENGIAVPPPTIRRPVRPVTEAERAAAPKPASAASALQNRLAVINRGRTRTPQPPSRRLGAATGTPRRDPAIGSAATDDTDGKAPEIVTSADAPAAKSGQSPLDRLRDLGRPLSERRSNSLRHTGLLRPVSRLELNPEADAPEPEVDEIEKPEPIAADSANTGAEEAGDTQAPVPDEGSDTGDGTAENDTKPEGGHKAGAGS